MALSLHFTSSDSYTVDAKSIGSYPIPKSITKINRSEKPRTDTCKPVQYAAKNISIKPSLAQANNMRE